MPHKNLSEHKAKVLFMQTGQYKIAYWMNTWIEGREHITLLHGFPSSSWDWHQQWDDLSTNYNLLACDFLGFGLSDKPRHHQYSILEQADIVQRLLALLRVSSTHLVAHDYGVSVAQELNAREHVKQKVVPSPILQSICFLNGGLFAEAHRPLLTQKLLAGAFGSVIARFMGKAQLNKSFIKIFGDKTPPSVQDIDILWALLIENKGRMALPKLLYYIKERSLHRDRWVDALQSGTHIPVAFVNGTQDPISGRHMLELFSQLVPNGLTLAMDIGHYPQLEDAQRVSEAIDTFVSSKGQDI